MAVMTIMSAKIVVMILHFMAAHVSQTTTSCCYIKTLRYAGYMGVGYSPQYIYYELLVSPVFWPMHF